MAEPIQVVHDEIEQCADAMLAVGAEYGSMALRAPSTDPAAWGHTEFAEQAQPFCDFVSDVVNALSGNVFAMSQALRDAGQMMCQAEDDAFDQVSRVDVPNFNISGIMGQ